ncbi:MAG: hypothetical protein JO080_12795 [Mucilaginibacter sp.]|nr:hypothetical protein [Mucilaginibacter sp.]
MKLNLLLNVAFVFALFTLISCKKSNNEKPVQSHDIYVIGNDNNQPVYWKNGVETSLTTTYSTLKFTVGYATGITFSGNDLYISGICAGVNISNTPVYWKNGIIDTLQRPHGLATDATSIVASGTDIYIGGGHVGYAIYSTPNNAVLWKNGKPTEFGGSAAEIDNLFIAPDGIYSAGTDGDNGANYATYYRNGTAIKLSSAIGVISTGIYVDGNNVYVCGIENDGFAQYAVYWKNGIETFLSSQISSCNAIYVSGGDIYVAGFEKFNGETVATVWKNGIATHLSSIESNCNDIVVAGNDIYVVGTISKTPFYPEATIWKNGVATTLSPAVSNAGKIYIK